MPFLDPAPAAQPRDLLIAFIDLSHFARWSRGVEDAEVFARLAAWYAMVDGVVVASGGRSVKCIGDAMLAVHPHEAASAALRAYAGLLSEGDAWLARHMPACRHQIKVHAGSAVCGLLGPPGDERLDVIGQTVNACALLPTQGLALSVAAFRALDAPTRKLFKKHTPPVTYIPIDAPHRD
jgi:class 3 adenylate cyclase